MSIKLFFFLVFSLSLHLTHFGAEARAWTDSIHRRVRPNSIMVYSTYYSYSEEILVKNIQWKALLPKVHSFLLRLPAVSPALSPKEHDRLRIPTDDLMKMALCRLFWLAAFANHKHANLCHIPQDFWNTGQVRDIGRVVSCLHGIFIFRRFWMLQWLFDAKRAKWLPDTALEFFRTLSFIFFFFSL